jgi:tRNA A37 threonylcarbamoyltransferase TsaD
MITLPEGLLSARGGWSQPLRKYLHRSDWLPEKPHQLPGLCFRYVCGKQLLVEKAIKAAEVHKVNSILLAGGVAANKLLREMMKERAGQNRIKVYYPTLKLCTDNAAMIAGAAYISYLNQSYASLALNAYPGLSS